MIWASQASNKIETHEAADPVEMISASDEILHAAWKRQQRLIDLMGES